ncbi:AMP-binding protein [Micromonospora sp. WMMD980]|uniref:AMP-binding protein n=1 Tax=Micromonospora sp. WMMD980 TaxID=3016088 RepID=UPI0024176C47|nr:AMP-binding protein [Micromonospora sp. WMMD980]MDG4803235.1 AMP-binding protein [Micromonospora sp. WMMD980]
MPGPCVTPESRVAVLGRRSPDLIVCILGTLLAGACFAVLDQSYPRRRLQSMAELMEPHAVVASGVASHPQVDAPHIDVTAISSGGGGIAVGAASNVAYLAFTSGTTGVPKCLVGGHDAVVHYLRWSVDEFEYSADDRFSMISGLSHDPLLRDVFLPLSIGASVHIPDGRTWARPAALAQWLAEQEITSAHLTPSVARRVLVPALTRLPRLRRILLGGEPLRWRDLQQFRAAAPNTRLTTVYGTTETPQVAMHLTPSDEDIATGDGPVPLGKPAPGFHVRLVGPNGSEPPLGEPGEIIVRSPHLALGRIVDGRITPLGQEHATGDRGHLTQTGELIFDGRTDRQVKIRGLRVELGEVEEALRRCPGVKDAIATVIPADPADPVSEATLGATAVVAPDAKLDKRKLAAHLATLLPMGAVPSVLDVRTDIPISPNGKLEAESFESLRNIPIDRRPRMPDAPPRRT